VARALSRAIESRLERHNVRLRGLGGPAVCGIPRAGASTQGATREHWDVIPKERRTSLVVA
jgi:hypothetical protein